MKRFLLATIIAVLALGLASCKKEDGGLAITSANLAGKWQSIKGYSIEKENGKVMYEKEENIPRDECNIFRISAGGTYSVTDIDGYVEESGSWELSGKTIQMTDESDEDHYIYDLTVERLTSDQLVLSASYHEVYEGVAYDEYLRLTLKRIE